MPRPQSNLFSGRQERHGAAFIMKHKPTIHECCGCSCHVCANGHFDDSKQRHTQKCLDRIVKVMIKERQKEELFVKAVSQ